MDLRRVEGPREVVQNSFRSHTDLDNTLATNSCSYLYMIIEQKLKSTDK